jgi:hypothetical protein
VKSSFVFSLALALTSLTRTALAQDQCGSDFAGCVSAPISFRYREGLPIEFNFDTDWVPAGSPVQVRVRAVVAGHTQVSARGALVAGWPEPMVLRAPGDPGGGALEVDYGVQFSARARLSLDTGAGRVNWEGDLPYVPRIDFRAMGDTTFDPWAWEPVMASGRTMRVRVADIALTDAIVRIPGISGGFTLEAAGGVSASYRSTRISFGLAADPITATVDRVQGIFRGGPFVEFLPRLEGALDYTGRIFLYPGLYVSLAGRRWMIDLFEVPIPVGPFRRDVLFDPSPVRLGLPDIHARTEEVDFGDVEVGRVSERTVDLANDGEGPGRLIEASGEGPFTVSSGAGPLPVQSRRAFTVSFTPVRPGAAEGTVLFVTNDPDTARVRVRVRGNGIGAAVEDAGVVEDVVVADGGVPTAANEGGCGCHTPRPTGGGSLAFFGVAFVLVGQRRARRRRT